MSRLSTFDFQTTRRRTARFSLFAFPPSTTSQITESEASPEAAVVEVESYRSCSEMELNCRTGKARKHTIMLGATLCLLTLAFTALLTLQVLYDTKHPYLTHSSSQIDELLAQSLFPELNSFYIQASTPKDVGRKANDLPSGSRIGLLFPVDKCEPTKMIQLARVALKHNLTQITLMPQDLEYAHASACLHLLEAEVAQDPRRDLKLAISVSKDPKLM